MATHPFDQLIWCDSYSRLPALLDIFRDRPEHRAECYRQLGDLWSCCDNIGAHKREVAEILRSATTVDRMAMMTDEEVEALEELPEVLTVYRGAYGFNRCGLSWSLDENVARRFPFLNRYAHHHAGHIPMLLTGRVRRARCVLKLCRDEREVIAPRVRITETTILEVPHARAA